MAQITVNLVSSGRFWVYDHVTLCIQSSYESEVEQTPKTYFFTSEAAFFFGDGETCADRSRTSFLKPKL